MRKVVIYTKEGCHLCERVIAELDKLSKMHSFEVSIRDITIDLELFERYRNIVPVVSIDGVVRFTAESLANPRALEESLRNALNAE
jgi:glutaredoxin